MAPQVGCSLLLGAVLCWCGPTGGVLSFVGSCAVLVWPSRWGALLVGSRAVRVGVAPLVGCSPLLGAVLYWCGPAGGVLSFVGSCAVLVWPHRWGALFCWESCCVGVAPLVGCSPLLGAVLCWCGPTGGVLSFVGSCAVLVWPHTGGVLSFVGSCAVLVWPHCWGALLCWELCCVGVAQQVRCSPLLGAVLCWCGPTGGVLSFVGSRAVLVWPHWWGALLCWELCCIGVAQQVGRSPCWESCCTCWCGPTGGVLSFVGSCAVLVWPSRWGALLCWELCCVGVASQVGCSLLLGVVLCWCGPTGGVLSFVGSCAVLVWPSRWGALLVGSRAVRVGVAPLVGCSPLLGAVLYWCGPAGGVLSFVGSCAVLVWPHWWGALLCWESCCVGVAPQVGCSPLLGAVLCWCGPTGGVLSFVGSCAVLVWPSRWGAACITLQAAVDRYVCKGMRMQALGILYTEYTPSLLGVL